MRRNRTTVSPIIDVGMRPISHKWSWTVLYHVSSSGYATHCQVSASTGAGEDIAVGVASCEVAAFDDLREVIECLAIESMMAACEPTLDGSHTHRRVVFSSNL